MSDAPILDDASRDDSPDEHDPERLRERYQELINELRVILPGVQVLFAFLITAPFSGRFGELGDGELTLFAVALVASTIGLVVLLTPVAYHRLSQPADRERRIAVAIRLKMLGLVLLGVSMVSALSAVVSFVYRPAAGAVVAIGTAVSAVAAWIAFPLLHRRDDCSTEDAVARRVYDGAANPEEGRR